jgi:hypothetical protein
MHQAALGTHLHPKRVLLLEYDASLWFLSRCVYLLACDGCFEVESPVSPVQRVLARASRTLQSSKVFVLMSKAHPVVVLAGLLLAALPAVHAGLSMCAKVEPVW